MRNVVARCPSDWIESRPFVHHLWLRFLFYRPDLRNERNSVISSELLPHPDTHPWELILLYRGLFLAESDRGARACEAFEEAIAIATGERQGPTMRAIGAVIAAAAFLSTRESRFAEIGSRIIEGEPEGETAVPALVEQLPGAATIAEVVSGVISEREATATVEQVLGLLPFNYY